MKLIFIIFIFSINIYAQTFNITAIGIDIYKDIACEKALINAKVMAIEEYGVIIDSSYYSKQAINNKNYSTSQKKEIIQKAKHKIRVISYKKDIFKINNKYKCKVYAILTIGKIKTIKTVNPKKLANYNKQYIKTCSIVTGVYKSKKRGHPIFINFGRNYPYQFFTAIVWENDLPKFSYDLKNLIGKKICIKGEVYLFRNKPNIKLSNENQIEF